MLKQEELKKSFTEAHPKYDEATIDRMVDNSIEAMYGSEKDYQKRLETEAETEIEEPTDDRYEKETEWEFKKRVNEIRNVDAAVYYERLRLMHLNSGVSDPEAETIAREQTIGQYRDATFEETPLDPRTAREIEALEHTAAYLSDEDKRRVIVKMRLEDIDALTAWKAIDEQDRVRQRMDEAEYNALPETEREFMELLDPGEKEILRNLKGAQPDANWTAEKYWRREHEGKRKPPVKPTPEPEPVVSIDKFKKEQAQRLKVEKELAASHYVAIKNALSQTGKTLEEFKRDAEERGYDMGATLELLNEHGFTL